MHARSLNRSNIGQMYQIGLHADNITAHTNLIGSHLKLNANYLNHLSVISIPEQV